MNTLQEAVLNSMLKLLVSHNPPASPPLAGYVVGNRPRLDQLNSREDPIAGGLWDTCKKT